MQPIAASELIIGPDKRIYHLNLRPEDIADTIITVGDPGRVARVSRHFDSIDLKVTKREFVTHTGWLGKRRISVVSTGIGPDNIDIVLNELDALVNIDFDTRKIKEDQRSLVLIRIGTTGSLQPDLPIDTHLYSAYALGLDNLLHFYEYQNSGMETRLFTQLKHFLEIERALPVSPYIFATDQELADQLGGDMQRGITLTCPGFYGPQGRTLRGVSRLGRSGLEKLQRFEAEGLRITNLEMETAAIYGLARVLGHRAISFNAVLANRLQAAFSQQAKESVDRLIERVLSRL